MPGRLCRTTIIVRHKIRYSLVRWHVGAYPRGGEGGYVCLYTIGLIGGGVHRSRTPSVGIGVKGVGYSTSIDQPTDPI